MAIDNSVLEDIYDRAKRYAHFQKGLPWEQSLEFASWVSIQVMEGKRPPKPKMLGSKMHWLFTDYVRQLFRSRDADKAAVFCEYNAEIHDSVEIPRIEDDMAYRQATEKLKEITLNKSWFTNRERQVGLLMIMNPDMTGDEMAEILMIKKSSAITHMSLWRKKIYYYLLQEKSTDLL